MAYATETRASDSNLLQKIADFFGSVADRYTTYQLYRETFAELSALSNRELADIGLARGDVHRAAVDAAYGK